MSDDNALLTKWRDAQEKLNQAKQAIDDFQSIVKILQDNHAKMMDSLKLPTVPNLDIDVLRSFLQQPYLLMPRKENSWFVIVPRFIDMQVGWLEFQTPCYDSETRVLTREGFKFFKDLTYDDEIFTLNRPMNRMEYKKPTLLHTYKHQGKMVHFKGESIDLLVTRNHRVLVAGANTRKSMRGFRLVEARNLLDKQDYSYQMLRTGKIWRGHFKDSDRIHLHRGEPKTVSIPHVKATRETGSLRNTSKISLTSFIKLFAWWVTEGSVFESTSAGYSQYRNNIANQSNVNLVEIGNLVTEVGFSPILNINEKAKSISFSSKQFFFFFSQFGKAHDKFIPKALKNLPQSYLRLLFDTMMKGDGSRRGDAYHTVSKRLAEDVAEIVLKLGYGVSITFLADRGTKGIFRVGFTKRKKSPRCRKPRLEDYTGNVYCVTIPNHIILVERNGKTCWSGNSFNVFVINKYVRWLAPLPAEIESRLGIQPPTRMEVVDGLLKPTAGMEDETWQKYRKYLLKRDQLGIHIKKGYERILLSELIRDGYLPFTPRPVDPEDLNPMPEGFEMQPHQKEGFDAFLKWGAIGIYWPAGQGKTYFGAALCKMIKGPKLIVVPNVTEKEQWLIYLRKFGALDVDLLTYQAFHKASKDYKFVVFDECHRLPAPVWSRFATIDSKYRIGLSATPYREDGREDLIIALTGYPIGISWEHFMRVKAIRKPKITVKVVNNEREKMAVLADMLKVPMKTIIFCELIASGEKIAKQFNLPFINQSSKDRIETINKNLVTVSSRVGDEGISIKDLERTIEVEFLGSSRRQESQRAYRLLHSVKPEISHTVIMTVHELDQFGRRFLALEEKGFQVEYVS